MDRDIYCNCLYMFDKREIQFGQKDGWSVNGINQCADVNSSLSRTALKQQALKKQLFGKKSHVSRIHVSIIKVKKLRYMSK